MLNKSITSTSSTSSNTTTISNTSNVNTINTNNNPAVIAKTNNFSFSNPLNSRPASMPLNPPPPVPIQTSISTAININNTIQPSLPPPINIKIKPNIDVNKIINNQNNIENNSNAIINNIPTFTKVELKDIKDINDINEIKDDNIINNDININHSENISITKDILLKPIDNVNINSNDDKLNKQIKSIENTPERPKLGFLSDISSGGLNKQLKTINIVDDKEIIKSNNTPKLNFLNDIQKGGSSLKKSILANSTNILKPQQPSGLMSILALKMAQRRDNIKDESDDDSVRSGFSSDAD